MPSSESRFLPARIYAIEINRSAAARRSCPGQTVRSRAQAASSEGHLGSPSGNSHGSPGTERVYTRGSTVPSQTAAIEWQFAPLESLAVQPSVKPQSSGKEYRQPPL